MAEVPNVPITDPKLNAEENTLVEVREWLKADEVAEAKLEGKGTVNSTTNPPRRPSSSIESVTTVIGRPTTLGHVVHVPPTELNLEGKNWIGLLMEYRQAHPNLAGPEYRESSPSLNRFTCTLTIAENSEPLGNPSVIFSKKKDAKQYAAKLAIEWLIANKYMPADGGVSFSKSRVQPAAKIPKVEAGSSPGAALSTSSIKDGNGTSVGQQVAELATRLGFCPPTYVITPHQESSSMYSGYAHFDGDPRVPGKVGEFVDIYGKKRAKEACAKDVLTFLEAIAVLRAKQVEARREGRVGLEGSESVQRVPELEAEVKNIIHDMTG